MCPRYRQQWSRSFRSCDTGSAVCGGFTSREQLRHELGKGGLGGLGVNKAEIDHSVVQVMPTPADKRLYGGGKFLVFGEIPANKLP